jgi:hypothetical protein
MSINLKRWPGIRHIRAIYEAFVLIFWRYLFDKGTIIVPSKDELVRVYEIWHGCDKKYVIRYNVQKVVMDTNLARETYGHPPYNFPKDLLR